MMTKLDTPIPPAQVTPSVPRGPSGSAMVTRPSASSRMETSAQNQASRARAPRLPQASGARRDGAMLGVRAQPGAERALSGGGVGSGPLLDAQQ